MEQSRDKLTDDQREYLRPSLSKISEGFAELRERLTELGWDESGTPCSRCDCEYFETPESGSRFICGRRTCGHGYHSHYFW
jgi:hypothetical protein